MKLRDVAHFLETIAPPALQEGYDNSGWIAGDPQADLTGVMVSLDATEEVILEAAERGCNLVVSHHPIVFKGLKSLTGKNYVERAVIQAIRREVGIYAIHTNLDNVLANGVNQQIANRLQLRDTRVLAPKAALKKAVIYGAGADCREALENTPDKPWRILAPDPLSLYLPAAAESRLREALAPWAAQTWVETFSIDTPASDLGAGVVGNLPHPLAPEEFLQTLCQAFHLTCIRHTALPGKPIQRVAACGGSGSFLLPAARAAQADVFVTADFKYHEFFDAENRILIADIGHFESEQFTIDLLQKLLSEKFPNFAALSTNLNTNPVRYYTYPKSSSDE